jgi:hypothetical protein
MSDEYRSLKVPTWVYENVIAAQNDVRQRGIDVLPQDALQPKSCPRCHHEVRFVDASVEVKFARVECPHCKYTQQSVSVNGQVVAGVGLGMLLGLGLYYLLDQMNQPPRRLAGPKRRRAKRGATR